MINGHNQRISRVMRDLAQPTGRFWLREYRDRVTYRRTRLGNSMMLSDLGGEYGVIVYEDGRERVELRMDLPYNDEKPRKALCLVQTGVGSQEIAHYNGKLSPVTVTGDLPENDLVALEEFAREVKQRLDV